MANRATPSGEAEAKARQLLDHLLDQWLNLADTFKSADPATVIAALQALDTRFNEFTGEIDPEGAEKNWYEFGRRVFRNELNRRIDDSLISIEHRIR
ncbi:hypothetical protein [Nitrolancea hollandica]|uniref:Uncharacterized protein n=1 Tax=Nitrolancea hollandica Lb TaxID=1129897 RepID=I4EFR5_9BACT|nr:hypothetical protein [Nitrolancea hollandica]CCF83527.1 hypothetical protein NITHO_2380006 [Nitrolancea hollandica Lb]